MGRYSSDSSEEERRRYHKKKIKRSPSTSSLESHSSSKYRRKKSKKTTRQKRRSRSRDRSYSRGRSRGRDPSPRRSRSRERHRTKRSRSREYRRSRSRDYRRSPSRERRRSHSRERRRSRSGSQSNSSRSHRRQRSESGSRKTQSRRKRSQSGGSESESQSSKAEALKKEMAETIAGYQDMTAVERAQAQMQLALKAAVAADEQLQEQGLLAASRNAAILGGADTVQRSKAIDALENDSFVPAAFTSSRHRPLSTQRVNTDTSHEKAIFGLTLGECPTPENKPVVCMKIETLMHPNLYVSAEKKAEIWKAKLAAMRRKKLQEDRLNER